MYKSSAMLLKTDGCFTVRPVDDLNKGTLNAAVMYNVSIFKL